MLDDINVHSFTLFHFYCRYSVDIRISISRQEVYAKLDRLSKKTTMRHKKKEVLRRQTTMSSWSAPQTHLDKLSTNRDESIQRRWVLSEVETNPWVSAKGLNTSLDHESSIMQAPVSQHHNVIPAVGHGRGSIMIWMWPGQLAITERKTNPFSKTSYRLMPGRLSK